MTHDHKWELNYLARDGMRDTAPVRAIHYRCRCGTAMVVYATPET